MLPGRDRRVCYYSGMSRKLLLVFDLGISILTWGLIGVMVASILGPGGYLPTTTSDRAEQYIRNEQFDFIGWTFNAIGTKIAQNSLDEQSYLSQAERSNVVRSYFKLRAKLEQVEGQISNRYSDPNVADPAAATTDLRRQQTDLRAQMARTQSLAEAVLQEQLSVILAEQGLTTLGQPLPPVAFHLTDLPYAFIISPRSTIRQDANLDISGDLGLDQQVMLEDTVSKALDVSALVVPLGGIGTYPTMVGQSSDLPWIAAVIAHEWTHNYLAFRPLGMNYDKSGELRTMNETTAESTGMALGALLIQKYYPELAPAPAVFRNELRRGAAPAAQKPQAPGFDFVAAMHDTRVTVDALLAQGKIDEAEVLHGSPPPADVGPRLPEFANSIRRILRFMAHMPRLVAGRLGRTRWALRSSCCSGAAPASPNSSIRWRRSQRSMSWRAT